MGEAGYELEGDQRDEQSARAAVMAQAIEVAGEAPIPVLRSMVCPYCGAVTPDSGRCSSCDGRFDPLSRQVTQNQMGPWSIRDDRQPHRPGCTYQMVARLIEQDSINSETVLRGPTTRQFWTLARHTPGVAHLLGVCHSCQAAVKKDAFACPSCHASFTAERDRQHLGLGPSRPLPGQGLPEVLALHAEPASLGGHGAAATGNVGVVSAPIGVGAGTQPSTAGKQSETDVDHQKLEEANRLARRWKHAWKTERRRAWIVMSGSVSITLIALLYVILVVVGGGGVEVGDGSTQIPAAVDE